MLTIAQARVILASAVIVAQAFGVLAGCGGIANCVTCSYSDGTICTACEDCYDLSSTGGQCTWATCEDDKSDTRAYIGMACGIVAFLALILLCFCLSRVYPQKIDYESEVNPREIARAPVVSSGHSQSLTSVGESPQALPTIIADAERKPLGNGSEDDTLSDARWVKVLIAEARSRPGKMVLLHTENDMQWASTRSYVNDRQAHDLGFVNFLDAGIEVVRTHHNFDTPVQGRKNMFFTYEEAEISKVSSASILLINPIHSLIIGGSRKHVAINSTKEILNIIRDLIIDRRERAGISSDEKIPMAQFVPDEDCTDDLDVERGVQASRV